MRTVVVTDLDGTVIFSPRTIGDCPDALVEVDRHQEQACAFMTPAAIQGWTALAAAGVLVPATTRTVPQYRRLRLPGRPPHLAIVCNGARLLVDGEPDPSWEHTMRGRLRAVAGFDEVWRQAQRWFDQFPFAAVRAVDDLFAYLTVPERDAWLTEFGAMAQQWAGRIGWRASVQGRKLYLMPVPLDKAAAVGEVVARLAPNRVVAGGDSLLDTDMLRSADAAIRPAHGELHTSGIALAGCQVTRTSGATAGDEIVRWYANQFLRQPPPTATCRG